MGKRVFTLLLAFAALFVLAGRTASANSIGFLLEEADLAVAGALQKTDGGNDDFDIYRADVFETIRGTPPEGALRILFAKRICYHVHLHENVPVLLFLRRMDGKMGLDRPGPYYMAFAAGMSVVELEGEEGDLILEAARLQAGLDKAEAARKAAVVARVLRTALEPGRPRLLRSAVIDAVRTPGALDKIDALDRSRMLDRYRESTPWSDLRNHLLDGVGEARPDGLAAELVREVRGPCGHFHREQIAALLAAVGGETAPDELVVDFSGLDRAARGNVLYVLGCMGGGRGVAAIRSVADIHLEGVTLDAVQALKIDRSPDAVAALGEIAVTAEEKSAISALQGIASINTAQARSILEDIRERADVRPSVKRKATGLLNHLSR